MTNSFLGNGNPEPTRNVLGNGCPPESGNVLGNGRDLARRRQIAEEGTAPMRGPNAFHNPELGSRLAKACAIIDLDYDGMVETRLEPDELKSLDAYTEAVEFRERAARFRDELGETHFHRFKVMMWVATYRTPPRRKRLL